MQEMQERERKMKGRKPRLILTARSTLLDRFFSCNKIPKTLILLLSYTFITFPLLHASLSRENGTAGNTRLLQGLNFPFLQSFNLLLAIAEISPIPIHPCMLSSLPILPILIIIVCLSPLTSSYTQPMFPLLRLSRSSLLRSARLTSSSHSSPTTTVPPRLFSHIPYTRTELRKLKISDLRVLYASEAVQELLKNDHSDVSSDRGLQFDGANTGTKTELIDSMLELCKKPKPKETSPSVFAKVVPQAAPQAAPQPTPHATPKPTPPSASPHASLPTLPHSHITFYFDGGARGNPGPGGSGVVLYSSPSAPDIKSGSDALTNTEVLAQTSYLGICTNNEAEYTGCLTGLQIVIDLLDAGSVVNSVTVRGDSKLIVEQLNGRWKCKAVNLLPYMNKCKALVKRLKSRGVGVIVEHVRREFNSRADELGNVAMDREKDDRFLNGF
jgi:probable phosphoglycerate mutase